MASKKTKIKFDAAPQEKPKAPAVAAECKTKCGRRGFIDGGWCSACFAKYKKGYFTVSGEISPDVLRKQRELEEKRRKRAARKTARKLEEIKKQLGQKLSLPILKVLSTTDQEMDKPKYCTKLSFWTSDMVCYSRLFLAQHKKCLKCKVHDNNLENLLNLTEEEYAKATTIAAPETGSTPAATTGERPAIDATTTSG